MSIGSLGIVGSLAATPLAQKGPEAEKVQRETVDHSRQTQSQSLAESASGIGQTEEESQASERDADGRRPWEQRERKTPAEIEEPASQDAAVPAAAKDPSGNCGKLLDIQG